MLTQETVKKEFDALYGSAFKMALDLLKKHAGTHSHEQWDVVTDAACKFKGTTLESNFFAAVVFELEYLYENGKAEDIFAHNNANGKQGEYADELYRPSHKMFYQAAKQIYAAHVNGESLPDFDMPSALTSRLLHFFVEDLQNQVQKLAQAA